MDLHSPALAIGRRRRHHKRAAAARASIIARSMARSFASSLRFPAGSCSGILEMASRHFNSTRSRSRSTMPMLRLATSCARGAVTTSSERSTGAVPCWLSPTSVWTGSSRTLGSLSYIRQCQPNSDRAGRPNLPCIEASTLVARAASCEIAFWLVLPRRQKLLL